MENEHTRHDGHFTHDEVVTPDGRKYPVSAEESRHFKYGEKVTFEISEGRHGLRAVKLYHRL